MTNKETNNKLELDLLDNGVDFILKGIDELFDEGYLFMGHSSPVTISTNSYKYGILHLFSGFLLILKERLSRHLPELIFKGTIKDVRQKLSEGKTPNTIDFDETLDRLEMAPKVSFPDNELKIIKSIQGFRNQFEHYKVSANKYQLWSVISSFLVIVDRFLVEELRINIETTADSVELHHKIQAIESVWRRIDKQRKEDWKEELIKKLDDFKSLNNEVLIYLNETHINDKGATEIFIECPECGKKTLIVHGEYRGICSNQECNSIYPITSCNRCGTTITGFRWEFNLCSSCDPLLSIE